MRSVELKIRMKRRDYFLILFPALGSIGLIGYIFTYFDKESESHESTTNPRNTNFLKREVQMKKIDDQKFYFADKHLVTKPRWNED